MNDTNWIFPSVVAPHSLLSPHLQISFAPTPVSSDQQEMSNIGFRFTQQNVDGNVDVFDFLACLEGLRIGVEKSVDVRQADRDGRGAGRPIARRSAPRTKAKRPFRRALSDGKAGAASQRRIASKASASASSSLRGKSAPQHEAEDPSTVLGLVMARLSQLVEVGRREDVFLASWCSMHGLASLLVDRRIRNIHESPVELARRVARLLRQAIAAAGGL